MAVNAVDPDQQVLRVLGIDPGLANIGFGVVEERKREARLLASEVLTTSARTPQPERLLKIHETVSRLVSQHRPQAIAIEGQYFHHQREVAFKVGQAVGVILLAAADMGVSVHEYGPMQVKQALVGNGRAAKEQVSFMVRALLKLSSTPTNNHVTDALGIALTHLQSRRLNQL